MAPRKKCPHSDLTFQVSSHADEAGFQREDWRRRHAATVPSGRAPPKNRATSGPSDSSPPQGQDDSSLDSLFPAPLVLPGDDLALDPTCPPQSLASWLRGKHRNKFTPDRKTLYVASVQAFSQDAAMMEDWTRPKLVGVKGANKAKASAPDQLTPPNPDDLREYLEAFYHGIPVKMLTETLEFTTWDSGQKHRAKKDAASSFVGLRCGSSCTRIRARPCPDGTYARQLILDAAITALPDDAYAMLFLVSHDLYEDDDDDFCCGRAYGGSRVAVVSSARYNPALLLSSGADSIDLDHTWPASHCMSYVARLCGSATAQRGKKRRRDEQEAKPAVSPLHEALHASKCSSGVAAAAEDLNTSSLFGGLWLCLLARTASHELGHCLGIGHCVYYACVMQGTAGMAEDCRQPPYLCPVCLKKLTHAAREATITSSSSVSGSFEEIGYVIGNYQALARFCDKWRQVGMFAGYKAWLDNMASQLRSGSFTF